MLCMGIGDYPNTFRLISQPPELINLATYYTYSFQDCQELHLLYLHAVRAVGVSWVEFIAYTKPSQPFYLVIDSRKVSAGCRTYRTLHPQAAQIVFYHFPSYNGPGFPPYGSRYADRITVQKRHVWLQVHQAAYSPNGFYPGAWIVIRHGQPCLALGYDITLYRSREEEPFKTVQAEFFHAVERNWAVIACRVLFPNPDGTETPYIHLVVRTERVVIEGTTLSTYHDVRGYLPAVIPFSPRLEASRSKMGITH